MNYYGPRELTGQDGQSTGRYHFASANDYRTAPVGYCANGCSGHDTAEEAREHFKQYLVNEKVDFRPDQMKRPERCKICSDWTRSYARVEAWDFYPLCKDHLTKESVARLLGELSDFVAAW